MSQICVLRWAGVVLALGLAAAHAADAPAPAKDAGNKRLLYVVKHRAAKDLAAALGPFFKGAAEFRTVPGSPVNALLISAAPSAFDDAVQAAQRLDRPPRTVSVEVWIAEAAPQKADGDKPPPKLTEKDLSGSAADVGVRMNDLQNKGVLAGVRRVELTALEGRPESVLIGASRPFTMSMSKLAAGQVVRSITYRNLGSQAEMVASVSPENEVTVDLRFEDSRPRTDEDGVLIGTDDKGQLAHAAEFLETNWHGALTVPSGQARVVMDAKPDGARLILVVAATVVEPGK